jgi:hypothetical protein
VVALDVTRMARKAVVTVNPVERLIKRRWHDELVRHPRTHAWVLNLYRAGERHPETVDDYFPVDLAPAPLAERMARHRDEEAMHARLYARAVEKLGEPIEDFVGEDVFNEAIRAHTPARFAIDDGDDNAVRTEKLAHFLAHAHFLEARIARSLEFHVDACARAGRHEVARIVGVVLDDEREHARYTREAVFTLLPENRAHAVLDVHARGELRANLAFSARQVRAHLARHATPSRMLWSTCARMMEAAVVHV